MFLNKIAYEKFQYQEIVHSQSMFVLLFRGRGPLSAPVAFIVYKTRGSFKYEHIPCQYVRSYSSM